jgi:hypothetical protein
MIIFIEHEKEYNLTLAIQLDHQQNNKTTQQIQYNQNLYTTHLQPDKSQQQPTCQD